MPTDPSSQTQPGAFRRFFLNGGRLGLPLSECADESFAFYLAYAIIDILTTDRSLDRLSELMAEARKRKLRPQIIAEALQRPELQ
jgi:hypothetical protein